MSTLTISKHSEVPAALDLVKEEADKEPCHIFSADGDTWTHEVFQVGRVQELVPQF